MTPLMGKYPRKGRPHETRRIKRGPARPIVQAGVQGRRHKRKPPPPPAAPPAAQMAASQPPPASQVGHVPEASPAPRPSAEEVARDPDIPKRIAQIQDPVQRAEAQTLLKEIKAEATARENSNQRAQVVELER